MFLSRRDDAPIRSILGTYCKERNRKAVFIIIMAAVAAATFFLTLGMGTYRITELHAIEVFLDHLAGTVSDFRSDYWIWEVRAPRALAGLIVGAGLAIGGVVMQNLLRNPLAEPYTMGISSGALFGVTLSIGLGISLLSSAEIYIQNMSNAFVFSLVPLAIILLISSFKRVTPAMMVLIGIAVMYMFSSFTQIVMVTSSSETMTEIYSWNMGTLDRANWDNIPLLAGASFLLIAAICSMSRKLDVMYMGDRGAQSLGLRVNIVRLSALILTSFLTSALVCITGTVGFVGLVAPHVARAFVGSSNRYLIPASMAFGMAFLTAADALAKIVGSGGLPVGVISALFGGPMFLYILINQRRRAWM